MKRIVKTTLAVAAITAALVAAGQAAIIVSVTDDAPIQSNSADTNYGSNINIYSYYRNVTGQPYYKTWMKLDASSLDTLTSGGTTLNLTASNATAGYTIDFYLLSGVDSSSWNEGTITWNNAPGNNSGGAGFTTGASATYLASFTSFTFTAGTTYSLSITGAAETALLGALNTGSRTATIAFQRTGSGSLVNNFHSTESVTESFRPTLTAIPEPSQFALLGLGMVAIAFSRRRK
jgi:hypothetical protein